MGKNERVEKEVFLSDQEALELCANYLVVKDPPRFIRLYSGLKGNFEAREELLEIVISLLLELGHAVEKISGGGLAVMKKP